MRITVTTDAPVGSDPEMVIHWGAETPQGQALVQRLQGEEKRISPSWERPHICSRQRIKPNCFYNKPSYETKAQNW